MLRSLAEVDPLSTVGHSCACHAAAGSYGEAFVPSHVGSTGDAHVMSQYRSCFSPKREIFEERGD